MSVMLYPCIFCATHVTGSVLCVACLTVFVNCLVKLFDICMGVAVECYGSGECGWSSSIMVFQRMGILCLCTRCSIHRFCLCMSEVISSFRSLRVFAVLMLFVCVNLHTM